MLENYVHNGTLFIFSLGKNKRVMFRVQRTWSVHNAGGTFSALKYTWAAQPHFYSSHCQDALRVGLPCDGEQAKGDPAEAGPSLAGQSCRVLIWQVEMRTGNTVKGQIRSRVYPCVPSRWKRDGAGDKAGDKPWHMSEGSVQKMRNLQQRCKVHSGGRAGDQHTMVSLGQGLVSRTELKWDSCATAVGRYGSRVRLVRVVRDHWCPQGLHTPPVGLIWYLCSREPGCFPKDTWAAAGCQEQCHCMFSTVCLEQPIGVAMSPFAFPDLSFLLLETRIRGMWLSFQHLCCLRDFMAKLGWRLHC